VAAPRDGFAIGARRGLIDPDHVQAMGEAVWLFLLCVDWQTDDDGWVYGCRPVVWQQIQYRLGKSRRTLQRWMRILEGDNPLQKQYIETRQTNRGFCIRVLNQKKRQEDRK